MTRYVCAHPSHRRGSDPGTIDVTGQVRLERALRPRAEAYLAIAEDVIEVAKHLGDQPDQQRRLEQLITGVPEPQDLPVILMSRRSIIRQPGRYELDELRAREPAVDRVMAMVDPASEPPAAAEDDVIVIRDEPTSGPAGTSTAPTATITRREQALVVIPEGVFPLHDLAANLAMADKDETDLIEAVRRTPTYSPTIVLTDPWRVVVTCPRPEGSPAAAHDVVFTGWGDPEPAIVYGTPVDAWDAEVEASALADMAPGAETARVERRLWMLLGAEALVAIALLVFGWASGGLALAAREETGWLGLSLVLAGSAIAFAAAPLFATRDRSANMNDTLWLQYLYRSRIDLMRLAAGISATLFAFAVLVGVIPPLFAADGRPLPAATVRFDTSDEPVTATVRVRADGFGADDVIEVTMREYGAATGSEGVLVGRVTRHGSPSGTVSMVETFAVDPTASYVSVLVSDGSSDEVVRCGPSATGAPGCTVLAVPQSGSAGTRLTVFSPLVIEPVISPSPVPTIVSPTPSPVSPVPVTPSAPVEQGGVGQPGAAGGD